MKILMYNLLFDLFIIYFLMAEEKKAEPQVEEVEAKVKEESPVKETKKSSDNADNFALGALVLGVLNLCSWCFPICGFPMALIGIVLGVLGMKSEEKKTMAIIGLALSALGMIATIINAIAGVAMSLSDWS